MVCANEMPILPHIALYFYLAVEQDNGLVAFPLVPVILMILHLGLANQEGNFN